MVASGLEDELIVEEQVRDAGPLSDFFHSFGSDDYVQLEIARFF